MCNEEFYGQNCWWCSLSTATLISWAPSTHFNHDVINNHIFLAHVEAAGNCSRAWLLHQKTWWGWMGDVEGGFWQQLARNGTSNHEDVRWRNRWILHWGERVCASMELFTSRSWFWTLAGISVWISNWLDVDIFICSHWKHSWQVVGLKKHYHTTSNYTWFIQFWVADRASL